MLSPMSAARYEVETELSRLLEARIGNTDVDVKAFEPGVDVLDAGEEEAADLVDRGGEHSDHERNGGCPTSSV